MRYNGYAYIIMNIELYRIKCSILKVCAEKHAYVCHLLLNETIFLKFPDHSGLIAPQHLCRSTGRGIAPHDFGQ